MVTLLSHVEASDHNVRDKKSALPFSPTAQAADQWLRQLNAEGLSNACRLLYFALRGFNRASIVPHQRLTVLEALRPAILEYSGRLDSYFLNQPFPLDKKIVKVARLAMRFQSEMARGYHTVTAAPLFAEALGKPQQAVVLNRALDSYARLQLLACQCYEALPRNYWRNLYRVFQQAEDLGLADVQVNDAESSIGDSSAREVLRQIALFHAAIPTRLAQWQIGELHAFCKINSHLSCLDRPESLPQNGVCYCLDLQSALPPTLRDPLAERPPNALYLSLNPLLINLLESGAGCSSAGLVIGRHLHPGFDVSSEVSGRAVVFVQGAEACVALLESAIETIWQTLERRAQAGQYRIELLPRFTPLSSQSDPVEQLRISRDEIWSDSVAEHVVLQYGAFGVVYQEESQAVLIAERQKLRIGELVLMAAPDEPPLLGIVRCLVPTLDAKRAKASVDLIAGQLFTARAYVEGERRRRLPAILVADLRNRTWLRDVVMPYPFKNGTWVTLEQQGRWRNQQLARLLENTAFFSHYQLAGPLET